MTLGFQLNQEISSRKSNGLQRNRMQFFLLFEFYFLLDTKNLTKFSVWNLKKKLIKSKFITQTILCPLHFFYIHFPSLWTIFNDCCRSRRTDVVETAKGSPESWSVRFGFSFINAVKLTKSKFPWSPIRGIVFDIEITSFKSSKPVFTIPLAMVRLTIYWFDGTMGSRKMRGWDVCWHRIALIEH